MTFVRLVAGLRHVIGVTFAPKLILYTEFLKILTNFARGALEIPRVLCRW